MRWQGEMAACEPQSNLGGKKNGLPTRRLVGGNGSRHPHGFWFQLVLSKVGVSLVSRRGRMSRPQRSPCSPQGLALQAALISCLSVWCIGDSFEFVLKGYWNPGSLVSVSQDLGQLCGPRPRQLVARSALRPAEWSAVALLKFLIIFAQQTLPFHFSLDSPSISACVLLLPCELLSAGWIWWVPSKRLNTKSLQGNQREIFPTYANTEVDTGPGNHFHSWTWLTGTSYGVWGAVTKSI